MVAPSERAPLRDRAAATLAMLALALPTTAVACAQVLGVDDWADSTSTGSAPQGAGGASQGPSSSSSAFGGQGNGASTASSNNDGGSTSTTGLASTSAATGGSSSMSSASATASASSSEASSTAASSSASTGVVCDAMACEANYPDNGCSKGICDPTSGCIPVYYNEGGGCWLIGGSGSCSGGICLCGSTSDCFMGWCMFPDTSCCVSGSCLCQPEWGGACP